MKTAKATGKIGLTVQRGTSNQRHTVLAKHEAIWFPLTYQSVYRTYYLHFNAASLQEVAEAYYAHIAKKRGDDAHVGGAMGTAEMIRQDKVHAICCTGANLEEDLFDLGGHDVHTSAFPTMRT